MNGSLDVGERCGGTADYALHAYFMKTRLWASELFHCLTTGENVTVNHINGNLFKLFVMPTDGVRSRGAASKGRVRLPQEVT